MFNLSADIKIRKLTWVQCHRFTDSKNYANNVFYTPGAGPEMQAAVNASLSGLLEFGTVSQSVSQCRYFW